MMYTQAPVFYFGSEGNDAPGIFCSDGNDAPGIFSLRRK